MNLKLYSSVKEIPNEIFDALIKFDDEFISELFYDSFTFNIGIITDNNNKVLGAGIVRVINEFKMIINPEISNYKKASIIKELMIVAINKSQCNEIIVNVTKDPEKFSTLLTRHFRFHEDDSFFMRMEK